MPSSHRTEKSDGASSRLMLHVAAVALLVGSYTVLAAHYRIVLRSGVLFSHFAYVPAALACMWWRRWGLVVTGLLVAITVVVHAASGDPEGLWPCSQRMLALLVVSSCIVLLREIADQRMAEVVRSNHLLRDEIAQRERAEQALSESEGRYRGLVELSPDIIYRLDHDGRIVFIGHGVQGLGYDPGELIGKPFVDLVSQGDVERAERCFRERRTGDRATRGMEVRLRRKGCGAGEDPGTYLDVMVSARGLWDVGDGRIGETEKAFLGTQGVIHDISERKRAESQLAASERLRTTGQLAAGVAHEVRNPLTAILAISCALYDEVGNVPEHREYVDEMRTQVDRLSTLMTDLLDISRPIEIPRSARASLRDVCRSAIGLWRGPEAGGTHDLQFAGSGSDDTRVCGEASKLEQVFINLLTNATQNSPEGTEIEFTILEPTNGVARVLIADRGSGIPEDHLPRVFDPFFTTRSSGTGLGLSLVKHIVDAHHGRIEIRNNAPLPGCTVEVCLPAADDQ